MKILVQTELKYISQFLRKGQITTRDTVNIEVIDSIYMLSLFNFKDIFQYFIHRIEQVLRVFFVKPEFKYLLLFLRKCKITLKEKFFTGKTSSPWRCRAVPLVVHKPKNISIKLLSIICNQKWLKAIIIIIYVNVFFLILLS